MELESLRTILGSDGIVTDPSLNSAYTVDWTRRYSGDTPAVLLPKTTEQVSQVVKWCYENAVALRAVSSTDGMTADWCHLPYEFLAKTSNDIINKVKGINRVTYDISSKPPATIEWE